MVRNYHKKTERKVTTPRKLQTAIEAVNDGWPIRKAADQFDLNRQTLFTAVKRFKSTEKPMSEVCALSYSSRLIIPKDLEKQIADYCIEICLMGFGLPVVMCRELTYEVAKRNNLKVPKTWDDKQLAGIEWFHGFRKRHPEISMRSPEACSIARAMAFNEKNVNNFFDKLDEVEGRHSSFKDGSRCYNLDETNTSTVQHIRKVISPKGVKQVYQIKGAERGVGMTTCVITNAIGALFPPVHIFPRKKFVPDLLINCYPGALGLANENGYMTKDTFVKIMEHFIKCTGSSVDNPTLLLMDNVDSHFSARTLDLAKQFGVTVLTFPPHCTHKLQPLDVGFFGPFKTAYDNAISMFLRNSPVSPPTIYRIAGFVKEALFKAATPQNIIKSFETSGIIPYNRHVFTEEDFVMAKATERKDPTAKNQVSTDAAQTMKISDVVQSTDDSSLGESNKENNLSNNANTSAQLATPSTSSFVGPAEIRGYPKAKETVKRKSRRKGKCMIPTDTPEKNEIVSREEKRAAKKKKRRKRTKKKTAERSCRRK